MALVQEPHHHRSNSRTSNKPFKSRHTTKSLLKEIAKGKLHKVDRGSRKTPAQQIMSKFDRRNQARQFRLKKRSEGVKASSVFTGQYGAPKVIAVVPLTNDLDPRRAVESLNSAVGAEHIHGGHGRVRVERFKQSLLYESITGGHIQALDACRAADFVILIMSPIQEVNEEAEMLLRMIEGQGISNVVTMVQNLSNVAPIKKHPHIMSSLKSYISRFFPTQQRVWSLDSETECSNVVRSFCTTSPKGIEWREHRSWMLLENLEWLENTNSADTTGEVIVTGVIRGRDLSANQLVEVGDWGRFQISKITDASFLSPGKNIATEVAVDEALQSSVVLQSCNEEQEDTSDLAPYDAVMEDAGEMLITDSFADRRGVLVDDHYYFSDDETHLPEAPKRVPKGTSNYQAAWFLGDMSEDSDFEDEVDSEGDLFMDSPAIPADDIEGFDQGVPGDTTGASPSEYPPSEMFVNPSPEEEANQISEYRKNRKIEAEDDLEYPDEIELPPSVLARERLAKYRGLKSFGTSTWATEADKAFEPEGWRRLLKIPDYKRAKKQAENNAFIGGISQGTRVHVHLQNVPVTLQNSPKPIALYSLLRHEQKSSVINVSITLRSDHPGPLRSKCDLILQCGSRRFTVNPVFSQSGNTPNDVHKFLRYLHPGQTAIASFIGPVTWGPVPALYFDQSKSDFAPLTLVATGTVLPATTSRIIAKRIILTGHPYKIHKKLVTVRYMFFNAEDVAWFKALQLWTKRGRSGYVKESLGTHGYFKATFDGKINPQDAVGVSLYKRVWPRQARLWSR